MQNVRIPAPNYATTASFHVPSNSLFKSSYHSMSYSLSYRASRKLNLIHPHVALCFAKICVNVVCPSTFPDKNFVCISNARHEHSKTVSLSAEHRVTTQIKRIGLWVGLQGCQASLSVSGFGTDGRTDSNRVTVSMDLLIDVKHSTSDVQNNGRVMAVTCSMLCLHATFRPTKSSAIKLYPIFRNCQSHSSSEGPSVTRPVNAGSFCFRKVRESSLVTSSGIGVPSKI
jgi:hypothetical protein